MSNIPEKRYYSIGEVCQYCNLKPYTLRYWEKKTNLVSPIRIGGNRRHYTRQDLDKIKRLTHLIEDANCSIDDATKIMEDDIKNTIQLHSVFTQINSILCE
jgi:DNA-binding transcriptional MerR regulator